MIRTPTSALLAEADALLAILDSHENRPRLLDLVPRGQGQLARRAWAAQELPKLPCGCHDPVFHLRRCRRADAA